MSRVANNPIAVPQGVDVNISDTQVSVKGPKGNLELDLTLTEEGALAEVNVGRSSGYDTLDSAAIRAAKKAFRGEGLADIDPVARAEYQDDSGNLVVPVPVNFMLME